MNRRSFLQASVLAGITAQVGCKNLQNVLSGGKGLFSPAGNSMLGFADKPMPSIRVGIIGVGMRGPGHVFSLLNIPDVQINAICDLYEKRVARQVERVRSAGRQAPAAYFDYTGDEGDNGTLRLRDSWKKLCERDDLDLIYICTPWLLHTPMAVWAMEHGKHVAVEVPAALTVEECWRLVDVSEKTRRHCVMLENCCYGYNEMLMLNMCRQGVFGDLVHGAGAYLHDLCSLKLEKGTAGYQARWRLEFAKQHDGNPYPTHGLGPICKCMDINCGDQLRFLTSVSSGVFRMPQEGAAKFGPKCSEASRSYYRQGDMSTTIIKTVRGRTILVEHDTTSPEPYSRINSIKGTKGIMRDYPLRLAFLPSAHEWLGAEEVNAYCRKYEHPLWKSHGASATSTGGHGGMDYLMNLRLIQCLKAGKPVDMDVYDAAAWSSLVELTEISTLSNGKSVDIPDFTRGMWMSGKPAAFA